MSKNLLRWMSIMTVAALSFVGCGQTSPEKQVVEVGEGTYPVTISDSYGKSITLEKEPQRVVSVAPNITEMIYELGAGEELVGRTNYCDYPIAVQEVDSIGTLMQPDLEKIISLEPDLVIVSTHFDESNAEKLEEADIPVMGLYEEHHVEGVYTMIETLGTALNKREAAEETVSQMKETIEEVKTKVKDLNEPSVYYVVSYGESGDYSAPENTFVGELIGLAGGKDIVPAADSWAYSLETLLEQDPQIIILRQGEKENFMQAEGYKELTAVKKGQVYEIDSNLIDRQGYRNAEGVLTLAKIFQPEAFK